MTNFGWDLPPGCSINDIPGNSAEDELYNEYYADMLEDPSWFYEWVDEVQHPIHLLMGRRNTWEISKAEFALLLDHPDMDQIMAEYTTWVEKQAEQMVEDWCNGPEETLNSEDRKND